MNDLFQLRGRVAVLTGGSGVLGGALAESLAAAGVRIGLLGRTAAKVNERVRALNAAGGQAIALIADVLDHGQLMEARRQVLRHWGHIDILLNAAGGNLPGAVIRPEQTIFDLSLDDFDAVGRLNLQGTVLPCLVFGEPMAGQRRGCILNISSMAAGRPLSRVVGYSAAKAALNNFTQWLAVEMARKFGEGVRVNAIAPGFFLGEQNRQLLLNDDGSLTDRGEAIIRQTPMGRFGRPDELRGAVHWLCSDSASFVTGAVIPVDGGFSAFSGV